MKHLISGVQILKASYGMKEPIIRIVKIHYDGMNEKNTCNKCQEWLDVAFSVILSPCSCVLFMYVTSNQSNGILKFDLSDTK